MWVRSTGSPGIKRSVSTRVHDRAKQNVEDGTTGEAILKSFWILIDFDPKQSQDMTWTDDEDDSARQWSSECRAYLREQGWPEPVMAGSGDVAHLLYRIDLSGDLYDSLARNISP